MLNEKNNFVISSAVAAALWHSQKTKTHSFQLGREGMGGASVSLLAVG